MLLYFQTILKQENDLKKIKKKIFAYLAALLYPINKNSFSGV